MYGTMDVPAYCRKLWLEKVGPKGFPARTFTHTYMYKCELYTYNYISCIVHILLHMHMLLQDYVYIHMYVFVHVYVPMCVNTISIIRVQTYGCKSTRAARCTVTCIYVHVYR